MGSTGKKSPAVRLLKYKKGELIAKEGDYAASMYRLISGKAKLVIRYGERDLTVTALGPGEFFGENAVIGLGSDSHPVSVMAHEDAEVEIWHHKRFLTEYEKFSGPLKYIVSQDVHRLAESRSLINRMAMTREEQRREERAKVSWASQRRRHYRKEMNIDCLYRPQGAPDKVWLQGVAKDISKEGVGLEVRGPALVHYSHDVGERFEVDLDLPNGNKLLFKAVIVSTAMGQAKGSRFLGMSITEISLDNQKKLGFFLMP